MKRSGPFDVTPTETRRLLNNSSGYRVRVRRTADQSHTTSGDYEQLTFPSGSAAQAYNAGGMHDLTGLSPERLTIKKSGLYSMFASIRFAASAVGVRAIKIRLNNSSDILDVIQAPNGIIVDQLTLSGHHILSVGDYLVLMAYQDSGGALNMVNENNDCPIFGAALIGDV